MEEENYFSKIPYLNHIIIAGYIIIAFLTILFYINFIIIVILCFFINLLVKKNNSYLKIIYLGSIISLFIFSIRINFFLPIPDTIQLLTGEYPVFKLFNIEQTEVLYFLGSVIVSILFMRYKEGYIFAIGIFITSFLFMLSFLPLNNILFYYYILLFFSIFTILSWLLYSIIEMTNLIIEKLVKENKFTTVKI